MAALFSLNVFAFFLCSLVTASFFKNSKLNILNRLNDHTPFLILCTLCLFGMLILSGFFVYEGVFYFTESAESSSIYSLIYLLVSVSLTIALITDMYSEVFPNTVINTIRFVQDASHSFKILLFFNCLLAVCLSLFLLAKESFLLCNAIVAFYGAIAGVGFAMKLNSNEKRIYDWANSDEILPDPDDFLEPESILDFLFFHNLEDALNRTDLDAILRKKEPRQFIDEKIVEMGELSDVLQSNLPQCIKTYALKTLIT